MAWAASTMRPSCAAADSYVAHTANDAVDVVDIAS
jgi:hypothetical protein